MCFTVDHIKPKVAEKDINVYKIGFLKRGKFHPIWKNLFEYKVDEVTPKVELIIKYDTFFGRVILEGYHSYSHAGVQYNHRGLNEMLRQRGLTPVTAYLVIPEGARFYENEVGEFVSETIILKSIVK